MIAEMRSQGAPVPRVPEASGKTAEKQAPPKTVSPSVEKKRVLENNITPEQRNAAVQKLKLELQAVQQQRTRLEYNMQQHNCIRLSDLGRDYDSEERRLGMAISQLQEGKPPQAAVNLLEDEAVAKNYQLQKEVSDQKTQDSRNYLQTVQHLDKMREKQIPAKYRTPVSEQGAAGFWSQMVWSVVRENNPHLYTQESPQNTATRQAEFIRIQNLLNLQSPVELVAWAKARGYKAPYMNAMIEVCKLKAGREYIAKSKDIDALDISLRQEISAVDEMIKGLGGTPAPDRTMKVPPAEERQMDSKELYTHLLKTYGSPAQVEQYVLATYQELMREGIDIQRGQNAEYTHPDQKKARAFARQASKNSLHKMRMMDLFEEYKAQNKMGAVSLESRLHEYNRQQALMNRLSQASEAPAVVVPSPTPLRQEVQPAPKDAIKLQLDGPRELKKDGKELSAISNLQNIGQVLAESLVAQGVVFPFSAHGLKAGMGGIGNELSPQAQKAFGDKKNAPSFWIEFNPGAMARYYGAFPEMANHILTSPDQIRAVLEHFRINAGVPPDRYFHLCMSPAVKAQMGDPRNITPVLLEQMKKVLVASAYPNPPLEQKISQMHFSV